MNLLNVSEDEWKAAREFFDDPDAVKLRSADSGLDHSFVKVEGEIYAMARHDYLGEGQFGKVKVCQNKDGQNFAVKIEGRGKRAEDNAEKKIMRLIKYLRGEQERDLGEEREFKGNLTTKKLYTVTKLREGKELMDELYFDKEGVNRKNTLTYTQKLIIGQKACKCIEELHELRVLHRDIKPENFISNIAGNMIVVGAIDFGFSDIMPQGQDFIKDDAPMGSPMFMAPEIKNKKNPPFIYSTASDVYALGKMFEEDLELPANLFNGMIRDKAAEREELPFVMSQLLEALSKQPDLDFHANKVIEEFQAYKGRAPKPPPRAESQNKGRALPPLPATQSQPLPPPNALAPLKIPPGFKPPPPPSTLPPFPGAENVKPNQTQNLITNLTDEIKRLDKTLPRSAKIPRDQDILIVLDKLKRYNDHPISDLAKEKLATSFMLQQIKSNDTSQQMRSILSLAAVSVKIDLSSKLDDDKRAAPIAPRSDAHKEALKARLAKLREKKLNTNYTKRKPK
jgi:serine/threonine protein kinase